MNADLMRYIAAALPAILLALSLHEFGHAAMATKMGDPTPRIQGRLTLNPLAHLDLMGTLFIIFTMFTGFGFGWGKPVLTNPAYYHNYRQGRILVAAAGPLMNICLAMLTTGIAFVVFISGVTPGWFLHMFLAVFIMINIVLAVFNLLPVPPLDGGHLMEMMLPWDKREQFRALTRYGIWILLAMMWLGLLGPIIGFFQWLVISIISLGFGSGFVSWLGFSL